VLLLLLQLLLAACALLFVVVLLLLCLQVVQHLQAVLLTLHWDPPPHIDPQLPGV
jgi:hypothetical protein